MKLLSNAIILDNIILFPFSLHFSDNKVWGKWIQSGYNYIGCIFD